MSGGYAVSFVIANTGHRTGTDVAQVYLTYPKAADEPPGQLAAFSPVRLAPVTPGLTVKTVEAELPLTVTRLVSVAPDPLVGPLMDV